MLGRLDNVGRNATSGYWVEEESVLQPVHKPRGLTRALVFGNHRSQVQNQSGVFSPVCTQRLDATAVPEE